MSASEQIAPYRIHGHDAASVVRSVERGVATGTLAPGDAVPSVRALARQLDLSPSTVARAYRDLRLRGVLVGHDRSRTVVGHRPPVGGRLLPELPPGTRDVASGAPDPALLPDLTGPLHSIEAPTRLYADPPGVAALLDRARTAFAHDGIATDHLAVVGGALDGLERVLAAQLRFGDRVAVEDPGYVDTVDLLRALGLQPVPMPVDDVGPTPAGIEAALAHGAAAVVVVPRAQNPTGAALTPGRVADLTTVLDEHPDVLLVEDDHAGAIAGAPALTLTTGRSRFAVVRSMAKSLGPDLRVALLSGDEDTIERVLGRQKLGTGWVSHLLQRLSVAAWDAAEADGTLDRAAATYAARRHALLDALADAGIAAASASGLNVWIPVPEEAPVLQGLAARGWAAAAGAPFRLEAPPAIRVTTARLPEEDAPTLVADLAAVLGRRRAARHV